MGNVQSLAEMVRNLGYGYGDAEHSFKTDLTRPLNSNKKRDESSILKSDSLCKLHQPNHQNKTLALNVSANHRYIECLCFNVGHYPLNNDVL